jgi:acyl-CoA thioester hydrolase
MPIMPMSCRQRNRPGVELAMTKRGGLRPLSKTAPANAYRHLLEVGPEAIDANGHVNNVIYVRWMQEAAIAHSLARGLTDDLYAELGATWVARSHFIEYLRPAFAAETLSIETWITDFSRSRCQRQYRFLRATDGLELARAETLWVYVSRESGRPLPVHPRVIEKFQG